ncbi:MarR family winged helix-turn-helix transcriptional regulator [Furfurilactobacillus siliginis]|uniref:HTH marR-type domain-containing protein n=1 Tax=Furfurilactobacillus siliginis TaxID=348151 RepID=A0A0R2L9R3_9LACO|nr:MarR family transcriptional regulator [Furfurilactobacillus siliginis]KRN95485.1 hypothetical protein IV55_GL001946 [Furfurilactobacillus siliginis]GEK29435.1 hypothetical protein LSI01_17460 [Furfurilactobacillus siliginis]
MTDQNYDLFNELRRLMEQPFLRMALLTDNDPGNSLRALYLITSHDGGTLTASDLADALDIKPSSVTSILRRLENAGFIERTKDADDARVINITATTAGQEEVDHLLQTGTDLRAGVFETLSDEEKAQLLTLLNKLNTQLSSEDYHDRLAERFREGRAQHHDHGWGPWKMNDAQFENFMRENRNHPHFDGNHGPFNPFNRRNF